MLGLAAADLLEFARLDDAQQLDLQRQVHFADLVEEQRAAARPGYGALAIADRAGKGAFDVAEHLAFHQLARDGAAVDGNERPVAARGELVDRLGAKLLAGAAFAGDEDGGAARRDAFDDVVDRAHRQRGAEEAVKLALLGNLVGGRQGLQLPSLQRVAHGDDQPVGRERLHHEVVRAFAHRLDRDFHRAVRGDDDDRRGQVARLDPAQDVEPVGVGQLDVEQHHVGDGLVENLDRVLSRLGVDQFDVDLLQHLVIEAHDRGRVLNQQQARLCRHALSIQRPILTLFGC